MPLSSTFRPFNKLSPWNTPCDKKPVDSQSAEIIGNLISILGEQSHVAYNSSVWSAPIHVIDYKQTPWRRVARLHPNWQFHDSVDPYDLGFAYFPIPDNAWADPSTDGHMIIVDPKVGVAWELAMAVKEDGLWRAARVDVWDLNGQGYRPPFEGRWWSSGVRGSGLPFIGGIVRPEEVEYGEIRHALAVSTPINRLNKTTSNWGRWEVCPPASNTDAYGVGTDYIPEGAQIRLSKSFDISQLNRDTQVVAKALQTYGAFVADNAPDFVIYMENRGRAWGDFDFTPLKLYHFEVVQMNVVELNLI